MKKFVFWSLLILPCLLGACALPVASSPTSSANPTAEVIVFPTDMPLLPTENAIVIPETTQAVVESVPPTPEGYPATPEDVVYTFLTTYQENPSDMYRFTTQEFQAQLPAGGINELLKFDNTLEGFLFESGSNLEAGNAMVNANVQMSGTSSNRIFYLVQQDGMWLINQVEIP